MVGITEVSVLKYWYKTWFLSFRLISVVSCEFRLHFEKNHSEDLQTLKKLLKCTQVSHFHVSIAIYNHRDVLGPVISNDATFLLKKPINFKLTGPLLACTI